MPALLRPANLFLLFTYLFLLAVPFAPYLLHKPPEHPWHLLGIEIVTLMTLWALCKRPAWFHWLLLPAFIAMPTELYLQTFYGQGISTHHLGIIFETSPREAIEFLGNKVWLLLLIMLGVLLWWGYTWRLAWRSRALDWADNSRWVSLLVIAFLGAVWDYGQYAGVRAKPAVSQSEHIQSAANQSAHSQSSQSPSASNRPAGVSVHAGSASSVARASRPSATSVAITSRASVASTASGFGDEEEDEQEEEEEASGSASASARSIAGVTLPKLPHWANIPFDPEEFPKTWPFGLFARAVDFYSERKYLTDLSTKNKDFKFGAKQSSGDPKLPEIVLVVIGESSRYDHWGLHGYERNTNPLLSQESNLVSFADIITSVSATRLSVPIILSRKPAILGLKDGFVEKSFLTAYKEAGFKTWWMSNQISVGHFDTPVSVFAKEADVVQFMNLGGFTDDSNYDQILLEPLTNALADPAPKKLIVLHTLGNHWNYSHRHPKAFDKWQPSLFGVNKPVYTDLKIKPALNNSYDNSLLYTDWFLSQSIAALKKTGQLSSMLYVSDHGQTLYDGSCNLAFHGHNTQYEFHIPALMWYSDTYQQKYPDKVAQLQKHRKAKLATENVFHSVLDIADIRYPDEHLEWSIFHPKFKLHKRYVDSYGWTNYDNAIIKGACHEVIDKGTPLKQEK
jgi:glucan phosphoethanolaminetransferase (alkaline phosphatase superfamily)